MNPLNLLLTLVRTLQGEDDPRYAAAGFAMGAALGLMPKGNLFAVGFLLLFFFFRVNKEMAILAAAIFTPFGYAADSLAHHIGLALLLSETLKPAWTVLYNLPVVPWTKFNNTVVLGNLVLGLLLYTPLFFGFQRFAHYYRNNWKARVDSLPGVQAFKRSTLVSLYLTYTRKP